VFHRSEFRGWFPETGNQILNYLSLFKIASKNRQRYH
jgi:hypothetical protein